MISDMNNTLNIDTNIANFYTQRSLRTEEIINDVELNDEEVQKFQEINSLSIPSKKDEIATNIQVSNNEIGKNYIANIGIKTQENILDNIKEKMELISNSDITDQEKETYQKEIDTMLETYDTISNNSYNGEKIRDYNSNLLSNTQDAGLTRFETTNELTSKGIANISFKNNQGENIKIDLVSIDEKNMKDSLNNLVNEINKKSEQTGVNASYVYDDENNSGRLVFSSSGDEKIDYDFKITDRDDTTDISTKASTTFKLSDLQSQNDILTEEEALAIGANTVDAKNGIDNFHRSKYSLNVVSNITNNALSELKDIKTDIADMIEQQKQNAKNIFEELKDPQTNQINFVKEVSNGLAGLNELSQVGSLLNTQANANSFSVFKLLT
jgi:hypothetical protein